MIHAAYLMPLLPLAGFVVLAVFGRRIGDPLAGWLGTATVAASFVVACITYAGLLDRPGRHFVQTLYTWIPVGGFQVKAGLLIDPLSMTMALFVTGVSTLIHLYSIGYMKGDQDYSKFFLYLNLFVASMLLLVLGSNLLFTFVGWEGVGVCSYWLIAFWFGRPTAASAGKKAFLYNRLADVGFLVTIFLVFERTGTIEYSGIFAHLGAIGPASRTAICLLLFAAAAGKSAQLPLFPWLADAMEGPTPVSALIHAATMVTAGVYLLCRVNPLLHASPNASLVVACVGAATAFVAATIALVEPDLKRVLAYSTISQLGYMFLGVGVGAFGAGFFHLTSHAFFKALLFLAAGAVMHALGGVTDMREMGGLGRILPRTAAAFGLGALALSGVPPLVGFVSKERILTDVYLQGARGLWVLGLLGSGLTAVYIVRAFALTFLGEPARPAAPRPAGHGDPPPVMAGPMWALGFLVLAGGLLGGAVDRWLEPVVGPGAPRVAPSGATEGTLVAAGVAVALAGIALAWLAYARQRVPLEIPKLGAVLSHQFFVEQAYAAVVVEPARALARWAAEADRRVIDGAVVGLGRLLWSGGAVLRRAQTGYLRHYAALLLVGALLILAYWVWR